LPPALPDRTKVPRQFDALRKTVSGQQHPLFFRGATRRVGISAILLEQNLRARRAVAFVTVLDFSSNTGSSLQTRKIPVTFPSPHNLLLKTQIAASLAATFACFTTQFAPITIHRYACSVLMRNLRPILSRGLPATSNFSRFPGKWLEKTHESETFSYSSGFTETVPGFRLHPRINNQHILLTRTTVLHSNRNTLALHYPGYSIAPLLSSFNPFRKPLLCAFLLPNCRLWP
jgi:hypothetical protein